MPKLFTESTVEEATLEWLAELGYDVHGGVELLESGERREPSAVILKNRLTSALQRINSELPSVAIEEVLDLFPLALRPGLHDLVVQIDADAAQI